jgi:UDP-N-acetylglucosamine acyltransferase
MNEILRPVPKPSPPRIHPSAVVAPGARIGDDVEIGPFCVVGDKVTLGDGCRLRHQVTIEGHTTVGRSNEFFPGAVVGTPPQDLKYGGEITYVEIGDDNIFREYVTVHAGTGNGGGLTRIGNANHILACVHVAHDCVIGDHCVLANSVQLAGHVKIEDCVTFGGGTGVHHFVTIGKHAFVGGMSRITQDVPPFMIAVAARGPRSEIRMINGVGLKRRGFSEAQILALKTAFMRLFSRRARSSGVPILTTIYNILEDKPLDGNVEYLCKFLLNAYEHGRHGRYLEALRNDAKWARRATPPTKTPS